MKRGGQKSECGPLLVVMETPSHLPRRREEWYDLWSGCEWEIMAVLRCIHISLQFLGSYCAFSFISFSNNRGANCREITTRDLPSSTTRNVHPSLCIGNNALVLDAASQCTHVICQQPLALIAESLRSLDLQLNLHPGAVITSPGSPPGFITIRALRLWICFLSFCIWRRPT